MEIKSVTVATHPAFHDVSTLVQQNQKAFQRKTGLILKNAFHNLGLLVNAVAKDKQNLFVFIPTNGAGIKEFEIQQSRFIEYAKKTLGNRCVLGHSDIGYADGIKEVDGRLVARELKKLELALNKFTFSNSVRIKMAGEYTACCVGVGGDRVEKILKKRAVKTIRTQLPYTRSFWDAREIERSLHAKRPFTIFSKWRRRTFGKRKVA